MSAQRGAVLVEAALIVTLLLGLIYGCIQIGVVGLEQLTVDGGAYTAAHQHALLGANPQGYEDAPTLAKATLPHLNSSTVSFPEPIVGEPPLTQGPTGLQYNLAQSNARHGGVSMIQPAQTISTVTNTNFATLLLGAGSSISVTGIAIDPAFRLINGHGDVGGNSYNTAAAFATASDPLVDGNNAPPYFVGYNYMRVCLTPVPPGNGAWKCPTAKIIALGLAEYLDTNNWGRAVNGVIPAKQAVFYEAQLHQNKFAQIAKDLSTMTPAQAAPSYLQPVSSGLSPVACVYSFDNDNLGSYGLGTTKIGDFPVNPGGNPALCGP